MRKLMALGLASLFLGVTGCQDTTPMGPLAGPDFHAMGPGHGLLSEFAMLDDLAVVKTGASGSGKTGLRQGSVQFVVTAKHLLRNHHYELNITIDFASVATFRATSDHHGRIKFQGHLELDPGEYRLDFFVTPDRPTIEEEDLVFPGLLDRDLLLRCFPATFVTIG